MKNPPRGLWSILATEWTVRVAAFLLWEAYDHYRLWFVPEMIRQSIRNLDLTDVLGFVRNAREVVSLVEVIDGVELDSVPASQVSEGIRRVTDRSPGRDVNAGDFVYFDPWEWEIVIAAEARERRQVERSIPEGHPRGFVFVDDEEDESLDEAGSPIDQGADQQIDVIDVTGDDGGSADAVVQGTPNSVGAWQASASAGGAGSSTDAQAIVIRSFLRGMGVPVSDTVTDVAQLQGLAAQWFAQGRGSGSGPSGV